MTGERMEIRPAVYKKEYPWLREVDSLALCNVQLDLERAFRDYRKVPESESQAEGEQREKRYLRKNIIDYYGIQDSHR